MCNTVIMFLSDNGGRSIDPFYWLPDHPANDQMPGAVNRYQFLGRNRSWAQDSPFRGMVLF